MSNALAKAAEGKVFNDNAKPNFGRYRFRILAHRHRDGFHGNFLIAEMKVLKAEPLGTVATPPGADPAPNESPSMVGSTVSYTENIDNVKKGGPSRFQTHLARVFENAAALNLGQLRYVVGEQQPGFAIEVECEVKPKWLAPDGQKFDKGTWLKNFHWTTVADLDPEAINAARAEAGLKGTLDDVLAELDKLGQ